MTNTNTFATIISDNRYIAGTQLTKDNFDSQDQWDNYTRVIDALAISAWNALNSKDDGKILGAALAALFDFFGVDAKATIPMQKRLTLACVQVKREQSVAMKKARKALSNAKTMLAEENDKVEPNATVIKVFEDKVAEAEAEVNRLASEPKNVWYNKTPMLTSDRKHASVKCRKLVEDTIADIIAERELMTAEELQAEALALKAERKARKQMKAESK
jgi:hypothetical protein